MQTLPGGIKKVEASDNAAVVNFNINADLLDSLLRNYREEIDVATKDATLGIYTTIRYKRPEDSTAYLRAVLSNKSGGYYLTDTWTIYAADGTTVIRTVTWTLTYDTDGIVTNKTYVEV